METEKDKGWNPYVAGALSGVVLILSVWVASEFFGASTSFVRSAGMIEKIFAAERVGKMDYFLKEAPKVDWQWMFVAGILLGAFASATTSGSFRWQAVPDMWVARFGPSRPKRAAIAFFGGLVMMFGARLAGGCTSGHGLSGSVQLAVSGYLVAAAFFLSGILTARILYGGRGGR